MCFKGCPRSHYYLQAVFHICSIGYSCSLLVFGSRKKIFYCLFTFTLPTIGHMCFIGCLCSHYYVLLRLRQQVSSTTFSSLQFLTSEHYVQLSHSLFTLQRLRPRQYVKISHSPFTPQRLPLEQQVKLSHSPFTLICLTLGQVVKVSHSLFPLISV